ncbi:hypothetical protein [Hyphococcus sp.]|uniref:hypothetical protein n=1 Tax=Hyphococcus sp. TaxID=2038636 RepID=UPI00208696C7|nr:MAG: hypothetical protein DHS20C04_16500 [Marinicaulis sp.]
MKSILQNARLLAFAVMMSAASTAIAQEAPIRYQPDPDSPIGERNPKGPAELSQFDFVIGDWDVEITYRPPQGDPVTYKAQWHNHWVVDGFVVMQEWRGPYQTGAEMRAWNAKEKRWEGKNIYSGRTWRTTHAEFVGAEMKVYIEDAADQTGPHINRETYFDISGDRFQMKSDKSYDEGETWVRGDYEMVAVRRKA